MKKLLMIVGIVIVLAAIYLYVGYGYCNFGSATAEIKNYTAICKVIIGWY